MKMRFVKWIVVFVLVVFMPVGAQVVYAEETLKVVEIDSQTNIKDTDYYSYTYTEEDKVTIDGTEYMGIVIPIEQDYAGGLYIYADGGKSVTTSDGEVYCALFKDMNFSMEEFTKASGEFVQLYEGYGETGTRYLVFYTDSYDNNDVTTSIQFQMGLYYEDSYEMKENVVYKNYAKDSEGDNGAYLEITTPGYYIFESDQDITLWMSVYGDNSIVPANDMPIVKRTDRKVMIHMRNTGKYNLSMTSKKGVPFTFTYYYCSPEKLELSATNSVPIYIGDKISSVSMKYTADKTGIIQLAGVSKSSGRVEISQKNEEGTFMVYRRAVPVSPDITELSKESFFVRKGETYSFLVYASSLDGYVNASFKLVDFVEGDVLGKPTEDEARSAKEVLQYNTMYYGTFDRSESTVSWIYIDKPCRIHFKSYKKNADEGYTLTYYDDKRKVLTTNVQNDNKEVKFYVLDSWTPGFLEINDMAGGGYYSLYIEEMVPDKGSILKGTDANYKVTVVPNQSSKTGGVVSFVEVTDKKDKTVNVPDTVTINGITYKVGSIDDSAFADNKNITSVTVGDNVTKVTAKTFKGCTNLKTVKLGNGVTSIPAKMFKNFKKLTTLKMGTKVKTIGKEAFSGCVKLSNVTVGKNVTTIGDKAFYKCSALTKITIPNKISKIGKSAFQNCKKLKGITIKTTKLTSKKVGKSAFKGAGSKYYNKLVVKVPAKKLKSYKTLLKKAGLSAKAKVKK